MKASGIINYGKPAGIDNIIFIPIHRYDELSDTDKEELDRYDPFLRLLVQDGVGLVRAFWVPKPIIEHILSKYEQPCNQP